MNSMASVNPFQEIVPESVSSSSARPPLSSFDVFINHCGADVKFTLATDIRDKLSAAGLSVFLDVDSLQLGDVFPAKIEQAMCAASLHIAIFSAKYAESPWCLAELSFMLHTGKTIIPVLKDVQPSDLRWVRAGKGIYAHAFSHYESQRRYSPEKLEEWKVALEKASFLNGIEVKDNKGEGMALKNIVNAVSKILPKAPFLVARKPVGLGDIVLDFERKTSAPAEDEYNVQIVGIVGMGGAGKTTLAKELYNRKSSSFQSSSFVFEVRDAASKKALHEKQKKLIGDLGLQASTFDNIEEGKAILASRLRSVHALIVLDDVDHENQLYALLPGKDCLASGSLVIVTTRERHLLAKWGATIYMMKGLKHFHAKQLFCWHAFLQSYPKEGFENDVQKFLTACDGLPLSLEVFGGLVYGRTEDFWESQLDKILRVLPEDIKGRLKVGYNSLDEEEQEMFMDVACFFIQKEPSLAIELWNGSGWSGLQGWETLVNKCLVNVDGHNYIRMHDHLRDAGRDLAGEQTHSRVWLPEQIMSIEKQARGGRCIRGIDAAAFKYTDEPLSSRQRRKKIFEVIGTSNRCFGRPPPSSLGLKLLTDSRDRFIKDLSTQLEEPIYLMLDQFLRRKLESWSLRRLRILKLISPHCLRELWDNSDPPLQLRDLTIHNAWKLQRIPASIGRLTELKRIYLYNCTSLKNLPEEFCGLRSVEWLEVCQCSMLPSLPRRFGDLINLRHVDLSYCHWLQSLPDSFKQLRHLQYLNLSYCGKLAFRSDMLESIGNLVYLNFEGCRKLEQLPNQITHQVFLRELNVKNTGIREVPSDIGELRKLKVLEIGSPFLASLPSSLGNLSSLSRLSISSTLSTSLPSSLGNLSSLSRLSISSSPLLASLPSSLGNLSSLSRLSIRSSPLLTNLPFSFENFSRLTELHLSKCEMLNSLPDIVGPLSMLKMIELTSTAVSTISVTEDSCPNLESLTLGNNDHLVDIQTLPTSLRRLKVENSKMLKKIKGLRGLANLQSLHIRNCPELNEIPSFGDLHSIKEVRLGECNNIMKIEGLENSKALETLYVDKWEGIQSLEGMEKLDSLRMVAENRSALQPCIQTIRKWPGEMWICGRAVSGAQSIMNSLSFPALTVVTSLKKRCRNVWKVECGKTHASDAALACFLLNSFQDKCDFSFYIHGWNEPSRAVSKEGKWVDVGNGCDERSRALLQEAKVVYHGNGWDERARARLQEGKWVYVGVLRQGCSFIGSGDKFTAEVTFNGAAVGKVEKGILVAGEEVMLMDDGVGEVEKGILVAGEEGRVLEAFAYFWPLFI